MAAERLAAAKEENERLRGTLTDKDREIFVLKVPLRQPVFLCLCFERDARAFDCN